MRVEHACRMRELEWEDKPEINGECTVIIRGRCTICGKIYEEVFIAQDELWDVEEDEYVGLDW